MKFSSLINLGFVEQMILMTPAAQTGFATIGRCLSEIDQILFVRLAWIDEGKFSRIKEELGLHENDIPERSRVAGV